MSYIRKVKVGKYRYLREVESVWADGKSKQKYIRQVGKVVDGKEILSGTIENSEVTNVTIYGPLLVLNEIANGITLHNCLGDYAAEILSMVYSHCIDPKSLNKMTDWFKRTELNHILNLEKLTERRLADSLDSINNEERIDYFQGKIFESVKGKYPIDTKNFFYDVTDVYFFGIRCKIAKKGRIKDGRYKRKVNIGLAVTREGIPIFHKVFPGDVFDARTLFDIMKILPSYGLKKVFLVWDRGVTSKINIADAKNLGFEVVCGVPMKGDVVKEADKVIDEENITLPKNRVQLKNCSYYVIQRRYLYENVRGYLYICLNRKDRVEKQEKRLKRIHEAKEMMRKGKAIGKSLKKYFTKKGDISTKVLREEEKHDGISLLFCTRKLSREDVVRRYFEKDNVEKAFACLRGVVRLMPIRKWLVERVRAHIFICYLSYLLLSILDYTLHNKHIPFSAAEAIEQLETMYKIYLHDRKTKNSFIKTVTLTKKQESILKAVNKQLLKPSD